MAILLLFLSSCGSPGCSRQKARVVESPPSPSLSAESETRYVEASIEIGCLTRREADPRRLVERTVAIYQHHGFEDEMEFLALTKIEHQEPLIHQRINDGLKRCP